MSGFSNRMLAMILVLSCFMCSWSQCILDLSKVAAEGESLTVRYTDDKSHWQKQSFKLGCIYHLHLDFPQAIDVDTLGRFFAFDGDSIVVTKEKGSVKARSTSKHEIAHQAFLRYWSLNSHVDVGRRLDSYIKEHPKGWEVFGQLVMQSANEQMPVDTVELLLNSLDISLQKSREGLFLCDMVRRMRNIKVGAKARDFTTKRWIFDACGKVVKEELFQLTKLRGKVVLMDFWAHWCRPCREGLRELKLIYPRLHKSGLEILAVNADHPNFDVDEWKAAIQKEGIHDFIHVQAAKNRFSPVENEIAYDYYVQAIPAYVLIDKQGVVRGHWTGFSHEQDKEIVALIEKLLAE